MNRTIKFRAWSKRQKKMYPVYGLDFKIEDLSVSRIDIDGYSGQIEDWRDTYYARLELMQFTGLKDKNGKEIYEGDIVSLDGNMTADDSLGFLPNGWRFDEDDKYAVTWDSELAGWVLKMGTEPDNAYNAKYMNHARSLLIDGRVEIIGDIYSTPDLIK